MAKPKLTETEYVKFCPLYWLIKGSGHLGEEWLPLVKHLKNAYREILIGLREVLSNKISQIERQEKKATKIKIE